MAFRRLSVIRFFRTLRFRLAATFLLLLAAVLAIMGFLATKNLNEILENQSEVQLNGQLGALKGWFTFDDHSGQPLWDEVDQSDPE